MAATRLPPATPVPAINYHDRYAQLPNGLNGNYAALYAIHHPTAGQPSNTIFDTIVDSTNSIPKVFLALVSMPDGTFNIIPVHNMWRFKPSMVAATTPWDGNVFAFIGDLSPTSSLISTVPLPDNIFNTVTEQLVHPSNYITTAFAAAAPTLHLLNPIPDGTPGTNLVTTRAIVPVPHHYTQLALSRLPLQPHAAWHLFYNAISTNALNVPCLILLDWLCVAVTKRYNMDGTTIMAPANHLGLHDTAFPPVIEDQQFADCRWSIITCDLPALNLNSNTTTALTATNWEKPGMPGPTMTTLLGLHFLSLAPW